jgi:hypothetical protein
MAKSADDGSNASLEDSIRRIANLLALIAVKDEKDEGEKARTLSSAGFSVGEVAGLLGKTPNAVSVALHKLRKASSKRG